MPFADSIILRHALLQVIIAFIDFAGNYSTVLSDPCSNAIVELIKIRDCYFSEQEESYSDALNETIEARKQNDICSLSSKELHAGKCLIADQTNAAEQFDTFMKSVDRSCIQLPIHRDYLFLSDSELSKQVTCKNCRARLSYCRVRICTLLVYEMHGCYCPEFPSDLVANILDSADHLWASISGHL